MKAILKTIGFFVVMGLIFGIITYFIQWGKTPEPFWKCMVFGLYIGMVGLPFMGPPIYFVISKEEEEKNGRH